MAIAMATLPQVNGIEEQLIQIHAHNAVLRNLKRSPSSTYLRLYAEILEKGLFPNSYTFNSLLKTFAERRALREGKLIHSHVIKFGFVRDIYTTNSLVRLYSVCGLNSVARLLFDRCTDRDLVSWTTMISGYAKLGYNDEAVSLFFDMMDDRSNFRPDSVIMATVLSACAKLRDIELGRYLHSCIAAHDIDLDVILGNALIDMYSKCGDTKSAYEMFRSVSARNVVTWNAMISGFAQNRKWRDAISLFRRMLRELVDPDVVTLVSVLNSCANLGALEIGEWVHHFSTKIAGRKADGILANALIDMYSKCGKIDKAAQVFANATRGDVYTYTSMISGYAMHGQGEGALSVFDNMLAKGVKPNEGTLVGVLSACSHSGLVESGLDHFRNMSTVYGIEPQIEHYGCVVDMLGRAGLVDTALEIVRCMHYEPDALMLSSLLAACKVHGNVELGEKIADKLIEAEKEEDASGGYVLLSNIYASAKRREDVRSTRRRMKRKKVRKIPGCSVIEVNGVVHEFRMLDKSHPERRRIYIMAEQIGHVIKIQD